MRAADRAYYGVYTPTCPIQPDSLRNRVHGVATWTSRPDKDGCISYESGLGRRKVSAIEFARYLEVLAMEMQPVLDTLVRATVADNEPAPKAWQFQFEMAKHAHSLREARSYSDLSFAHVVASQQCAKAVHFYRKYRKQAEDLLHVTPQLEPAQQMTSPPTSVAPSAGHRTSRVAHEHPPVAPSPSIRASTSSKPLLGLPAGGEEVGLGSPAHTPPRKDEPSRAGNGSSSTNTTVGLATMQRCPSQHTRRSGKADEATRRESPVQVTPSETALPNRKISHDGHTLDSREDEYSSRVCHSTQPRTSQESQGEGEVQSPLRPARPRPLWCPNSPPHLAHLPNSLVSSPSMATAASMSELIEAALSEAQPGPIPPANSNKLAIRESDISAREGSRARRAPWSETLWAARSPRQSLSSCPAPALGLMVAARESSRMTVVSSAKAEERPKSGGLGPSRMGDMNANTGKCPLNVPPPPHVLLPSSHAIASQDKSDAPARSLTTRLVLARELVSPELDVNAREGSSTQCAPLDELREVDVSRAQAWRILPVARSRTSLAPPTNLKELSGSNSVSGQRESGARCAPWSDTCGRKPFAKEPGNCLPAFCKRCEAVVGTATRPGQVAGIPPAPAQCGGQLPGLAGRGCPPHAMRVAHSAPQSGLMRARDGS
ncbi:uncharacterized protein SCHCODRAFT_01104156 [Schizophyllum commune H4-8]|nr:uncharacterized protein SCHCODRAFT_01104156 [Schizophyllum commune H4-8]KAI5887800.1 hypothetical protein SCHCODRAFT_01104156 [Schizophyllum commune H4-8]